MSGGDLPIEKGSLLYHVTDHRPKVYQYDKITPVHDLIQQCYTVKLSRKRELIELVDTALRWQTSVTDTQGC